MELKHYGILGMKWGVRRYQNPDGSYTDAGKKRYNMSEVERKWAQGREEDTDRKKDYNPRAVTTTKHKRAKVTKQMSDEELDARIQRLQKETQYLQLEKNLDSLDITTGKSMAVDLLNIVGKQIMIPVGVGVASSLLTSLLLKYGLDEQAVNAARTKLGIGKGK